MKKFYCILILLISTKLTLFGQLVLTIDYTTPGLGSSCNIFTSSTGDHSVTYQNLKHQTSFGFPYYSPSEMAVALQSKPSSQSQQGATQYSIAYSFKNGYTYKIRIYGKAVLGGTSASFPSIAINWNTTNGGTNTSTSCTGPATVSGGFDASYGHGVMSSNYAWGSYLLNGVADKDYSYLLVAAVPAQATYNQDNTTSTTYIQKIEITEITPVSFTLPSTTNVTCGSTSPVTFTVTNVNNTPNITDYTWNLGTTPNGWLYNGSPAPATVSTGTVNTISLTPNCGSTLSNISATVTAGGNQYSTNTTTVTSTQPAMSINGSSSFCSGNPVYSITGLPCNASVVWTSNPTGIVSITTSNNQATLTKLVNGQTTLIATITSCGTQTVKNLSLEVGYPGAPDFIEIYGNGANDPLTLCPGSYRAEAFSTNTYSQYEWLLPSGWSSSVSGGNNPFIASPNGFDIPITVTSLPSTDYVRVRAVNGCGYSDAVFLEVGTDCFGTYAVAYTISPNPAKDKISIDGRKKNKNIKEVQLIDKSGNVKRTVKYSGNLKIITFDVSGFVPGVYYLRIFDGEKWNGKQLSIQ